MFFVPDGLGMLLTVVGLPLVFLPQWWVKSTVERYSQVSTLENQRGVDIAREILTQQGIHDVNVEMVEGVLSDHYDPSDKTVRLSADIYHGTSVASVAIAAHEVGHAIQHHQGYFPVVIRSAMVPAVNLGSQLGPLLIMFGFMLMMMKAIAPELGMMMAWVGVFGFGAAVAFHLVTLPVEIDASWRALSILNMRRYLNPSELSGAKWVLVAAACTYVATALYALLQLAYYVYQLLGSNRSEE